MSDFSYEIIKEIAVLSQSKSGWTKELNLVSYGGRDAKYDIRDWAPGHEKMGKGVTLQKEELLKLRDVLKSLDI